MFEEIAAKGAITRPGDGKEPGSVAFLQCAGQRTPTICRMLHRMLSDRSQASHPDQGAKSGRACLRDLQGDAHSAGRGFYRSAQEAGVLFIRCQSPEVQVNGDRISVEAQDELLGEKLLLRI